jgi:hypothetical protein
MQLNSVATQPVIQHSISEETMKQFNRLSVIQKTLAATLMTCAFSAAQADQWEFKSSYGGGVDLILNSSAFNAALNGWSIISAEPNAYTLWTTGEIKSGYVNANFIYNDASGPTVTQGSNSLILNLPGGDGNPVDLWAYDQTGQSLIGPFGGYHTSTISLAPVPEPATYAMLLAGGLLLGVAKARKLNAQANG